jgi:protein-disulfide isomerase
MGRFERVLNVALVLAALWITTVVGVREVRLRSARPRVAADPEFLADWRSLVPIGLTRGSAGARMHVIEFVDLECPYCRRFHESLEAILASDSGAVVATFVHYPLAMHRFALPAALAAECAHEQGRFFPFVDRVFRGQDSLGLKGWSAFADEAGVPDTVALNRCIRHTRSAPRVTQGLNAGSRIGVRGTPTVIINGWKLVGTPALSDLERALAAIERNEDPFAAKSKPQ